MTRSSAIRPLLIFCFNLLHCSLQLQQQQRKGSGHSPLLDWRQTTCKGILPEPQCHCSEFDVLCINAQLKSPDVTLSLIDSFPRLKQLTFHGNNFGHLQENALQTNQSRFVQLQLLNLSANYLVTFHPRAFFGLNNVEKLDLSENEIILDDTTLDLFSPMHRLKDLYLRRAFRQSTNRLVVSSEKQLERLENIFRTSRLFELERLDLSMNALTNVRSTLFCPIDKLTHLYLAWNQLKRLDLDLNCIRNLKVLDLRENHFSTLDSSFYRLANRLPMNALRLQSNPFECYCNSTFYLNWLNSTDKVIDKTNLTCDKASPRQYSKRQLLKVPSEKLDCPLFVVGNAFRKTKTDWLTILAYSIFFCSNLCGCFLFRMGTRF